ncbi:MAG: hypothetical protein AAF599_18435 [Bacteroidota bacterium]
MTFNDLRAKVRADGTFFLGTNGESGYTTKKYPEQSTINFAGIWIAGKDILKISSSNQVWTKSFIRQ